MKYDCNTIIKQPKGVKQGRSRTVLLTSLRIPSQAASLFGAPAAIPLPVAVKDLGIDVTALAVCAFVLKRDNTAKNKQVRTDGHTDGRADGHTDG